MIFLIYILLVFNFDEEMGLVLHNIGHLLHHDYTLEGTILSILGNNKILEISVTYMYCLFQV